MLSSLKSSKNRKIWGSRTYLLLFCCMKKVTFMMSGIFMASRSPRHLSVMCNIYILLVPVLQLFTRVSLLLQFPDFVPWHTHPLLSAVFLEVLSSIPTKSSTQRLLQGARFYNRFNFELKPWSLQEMGEKSSSWFPFHLHVSLIFPPGVLLDGVELPWLLQSPSSLLRLIQMSLIISWIKQTTEEGWSWKWPKLQFLLF